MARCQAVVAEQAECGLQLREQRAAAGVGDDLRVGQELFDVDHARQRRPLLGHLADEERGADAAVWMAAALERAPVGAWALE